MNKNETPANEVNAETIAFLSSIAGEVLSKAIDDNSLFAGANVHFLYRDHHNDLSDGTYGIGALIIRTLKQRGAYSLEKSLTFRQIENKVRKCFGWDRYPTATLRTYLKQKLAQVVVTVRIKKGQPMAVKGARVRYYLASK
jgi:hypothetical protein